MVKLSLQDKILAFMQRESYAPMTAEEMIFAIPVKEEPMHEFWDAILNLEQDGYIVKTRFDTYGLPEKMGLVAGRFQLSSKGFGFLIPDNKGNRPDVFIPPRKIHGAMNNDRVMARVDSRVPGRRPEGEIIRIIKHANSRIVGVFRRTMDFAFVTPDDKRIGGDIYILRKNFGGAANNQKVIVEITEWPTENRRSAEGRVVEILGYVGDPGLEILSIIKQHDLPLDFPDNVKRAAARVPAEIRAKDWKGREDRRDYPVVTVDSEDARDLDDAVYVRRLSNGRYLLGVYIADVSYYVKAKTLLDQEAEERGTSVYLVDRVLPMLPQRLSNGICSLNENEDRLVMGCEMEIEADTGKVAKYKIFPAVIHSHHRLSYNLVRSILEEGDKAAREKFADIAPMLEEMRDLCRVLQKKRARRGAIEFDLPEQKVILDASGKPLEIKQRIHGLPEAIIEEFMLAANETVARHLTMMQWPCVYRVHETPAEDKMEGLAKLLQSFNVKLRISKNGMVRPKDVQDALAEMKERPEERLVNTVALRCMRQAVYQTENIGHFGLAAEYYCHFTSPIRRYPDLLVHRLLHAWLKDPDLTRHLPALAAESLEGMAEHSSAQERNAAEAERETVDLKKAEYMLGHIGETFEGVISGVASFGMFVELPNGVEGLVHMSSLTDDYYEFVEDRYCLTGTHTGNTYRLGDTVEIEVLQVNMEDRSIDFIMAGENEGMRDYIKTQLGSRSGSSSVRNEAKKTGRPYAKRGKGGIGGNKYAGFGHRKKRRRR
ncbi:MAG: ribonuclease R [Succiniclasticum sp.]|uniref:ribonuclease R n=1 Tax=Succiniclasticum sp. TaxID=2775030 RepID=UPI002A90EFF9|nr:ribonuclease R [Succiniclasticum sp.]MDY6291354.1 ribonuclease R [Succiniclasticum sp.]